MAVTLLPNIEALVGDFLRDQAEVTALVGDRVYSVLPNSCEFPAVRVVQFDDVKITQRPLWVARFDLQLDAFGGTKAHAWTIAATCQSVLAERLEDVHPHGVVSGVTFGGMSDQPDDAYAPAKPRFLVAFSVTAHPL